MQAGQQPRDERRGWSVHSSEIHDVQLADPRAHKRHLLNRLLRSDEKPRSPRQKLNDKRPTNPPPHVERWPGRPTI